MKYQSELIKEMIDSRGHGKSSIHYQSECVETWIEENKGSYPKLCEYESEWLNYIVQNPNGEFPYETVSTNTTATVNHVVPYAYKSAILKGQTLVNLISNNTISVNGGESNWKSYGYLSYTLTSGEKYLIKAKFTENTINHEDGVTLLFRQLASNGATQYASIKNLIKNGYMIATIDSDKPSIDNISFYANSNATSGSLTLKDLLIMKYQDGMENWDISYFEGMQSVKMPVLTTTNRINVFIENKEISRGFYNAGSGVRASHDYLDGYICDVEPNTTYSLYFKGGEPDDNKISHISFWNENTFISGWTTNPITFTTPTNCNKLRFAYDRRATNINPLFIPSNIVLSIGTGVVYDESFKSNILTTNEEVELRGIGDVQDTLDCLTGELTERIGEVVLDGSEGWSDHIKFSNGDYKAYSLSVNGLTSNIVCDGLKILPNSLKYGTNEGVFVSDNLLIVKKNIATRELLKQWLSQNPITVQYELETEVIKTVDLTVTDQDGNTLSTIKPIEETMYITPTGEPIAPTAVLEVPVEAITQNLASFIEGE